MKVGCEGILDRMSNLFSAATWVPPAIRTSFRSPRCLLLTWASQWGLWLIFADNAGFRELIAGALGAAISTFVVGLFLARTRARFKLQRQYLAQVVHIPKSLLSDTWILLRAIAMRLRGKELPGGIVAVPFRVGTDDPRSRGRRALAITFLTFTPNTLVLGFARGRQLVFFHTVIPQPLPGFMLKMGAEPGRAAPGTAR